MNLVPRVEWGARPPDFRRITSMNSPSTAHWNGPTIIINGLTTWDHSRCASLVRGIQNYHMDNKGWSDIAYNFLVCPHGYVFEGRGINVINGANGTNIGNYTSHAICCLAGEGNVFSDSEKQAFRDCVEYISNNTGAPNQSIGHRDHKSTTCPGDERYLWVHQGMPGTVIVQPTPIFTEDEDMHILMWNGNEYSEESTEIHDLHYDPPKSLGKGAIAKKRAQFLIDCGVAVVDSNKLPFPDTHGLVVALGGTRSA